MVSYEGTQKDKQVCKRSVVNSFFPIKKMVHFGHENIPVSTMTLPCRCVPRSGTSNRDMVFNALHHQQHRILELEI